MPVVMLAELKVNTKYKKNSQNKIFSYEKITLMLLLAQSSAFKLLKVEIGSLRCLACDCFNSILSILSAIAVQGIKH